jgi:hypothetical protein
MPMKTFLSVIGLSVAFLFCGCNDTVPKIPTENPESGVDG